MQFTVAHNNSTSRDELYRTTVQGGLKNGGKIVQIYEKNTGRYFYLVSLGLYIDGVHYAAVFAKVMGIDPHDGTWRTYADAKNYYHPSNYFEALLRVTAAGDLLLSFWNGEYGFQNIRTYQYILSWNDADQKFDYIEKGFGEEPK